MSYNSTASDKHAYYFAKLSILELCGWIEMSMDDVILRHCNRKVSEESNSKYVRNEIIKKTYGFEYDRHFRGMLIKLIGIIELGRIEKSIDSTVKILFESELNSLKVMRNSLAHTYTKRVQIIDGPSVTRMRFAAIYDGIVAYDKCLRNL